jgi:hypothetical protein
MFDVGQIEQSVCVDLRAYQAAARIKVLHIHHISFHRLLPAAGLVDSDLSRSGQDGNGIVKTQSGVRDHTQ